VAALRADRSVVAAGDNGHLLAAATLAALEKASAYDSISRRLEDALDASFKSDPIWGVPTPDAAYIRSESSEIGLSVTVTVE
jgi:hypothetical protein